MNNESIIMAYRAAASITNHYPDIERVLLEVYESNKENIKKLSLKQHNIAEQKMVKSFENYVKVSMVLIFAEKDKTTRMIFTEALRNEIGKYIKTVVKQAKNGNIIFEDDEIVITKFIYNIGSVVLFHKRALGEEFPFEGEDHFYHLAYLTEEGLTKDEELSGKVFRTYKNDSVFYDECLRGVNDLQNTFKNCLDLYIQNASSVAETFVILTGRMLDSNMAWESVEELHNSGKFMAALRSQTPEKMLEYLPFEEDDGQTGYEELSTIDLFYIEVSMRLMIEILDSIDLLDRINADLVSSNERKLLVNRAFIAAETRGYDTEDEDFRDNISLCQIIVSDIISGYISLLYSKEKTSLYHRMVQRAKSDIETGKTNVTRKTKDIKVNKKQKDNFLEENSKLRGRIQELEKELSSIKKNSKEELKQSGSEKQEIKTQLKKANKQIAEQKMQLEALEELLEQYEIEDEIISEDIIDKETVEKMLEDKKIIIWGLRPEVAEKLIADHPGLNCIVTDKRKGAELTKSQIEGCDGVVIVTNHTTHGMYWKVRNDLSEYNVPYVHMNKYQNNIDRFRSVIADLVTRINKTN